MTGSGRCSAGAGAIARSGTRRARASVIRCSGRRPGRLGVVLAGLAAMSAGAGTASGASARTRPPATRTRPPAARTGPLSARLGDWEGGDGGLHASFQLESQAPASRASAPRRSVYDLVIQAPSTCPASKADAASTLFGVYGDRAPGFGVAGDGSFPLGGPSAFGALTGPAAATISRSYAIGPHGPAAQGCTGHLHFAMHPASRRPVSDGAWSLSGPGLAPSVFSVRAGGRLAYAIEVAHVLPRCRHGSTRSFSGRIALFIDPSGAAHEVLRAGGSRLLVSLSFVAAGRARGAFTATRNGCTSVTQAIRATHATHAAA